MWGDLQASDWIAVCAGAIALLALVTTLWQSMITRRHNHLSARPVLDFDCHTREQENIGVTVKNCGPGPAFLASGYITYKKTRYNLFVRREVQLFLKELCKDGLPATKFAVSVPSNTSVIAPGQSMNLFLVQDNEQREHIATSFDDLMHHISIEISYKSLYERTYEASFERPVVSCS